MKQRLYNGRGKLTKSIWYQDLSKIKSVRLEHLDLLALPAKRFSVKAKKHVNVSRAALHSRASKRTIALSLSRSNLYERLAKEQSEFDKLCRFRVSPGARHARASQRVKNLAIPKLRQMMETKEYFSPPTKRRKRINFRIKKAEQLWGVYPRHFHSGISEPIIPKKKKNLLESRTSKEEKRRRQQKKLKIYQELIERIASLAVPKKVFPPRRGRKRKWKPLPQLMPRVVKLSTKRYYDIPLDKEPFQVSRSAMKYKASERIKNLSKPKTYEEIKPFETPYDYLSHPANACHHCIKLATPKVAAKKEEEAPNEWAFKVKPLALVAFCSPRTKKLAKPRRKFTA